MSPVGGVRAGTTRPEHARSTVGQASSAETAPPVLFVSDLHLAPERPEAAEAFLRFLAGPARAAGALYILGDLFEYWIGDDLADDFSAGILGAIGELGRSGVQSFFMHGNRDFLLGRRAAATAALTLLPDPTLVDLFGTPTLLMHGDTLCIDDVRYQTARARWRRPTVIRAFLLLPAAVRRRIVARLRDASERTKRSTPAALMDVNTSAVEAALRAHGYPRLIHGHTHRPARHIHHLDGQRCERWVLADWYGNGRYLRVDAGGGVEVHWEPAGSARPPESTKTP